MWICESTISIARSPSYWPRRAGRCPPAAADPRLRPRLPDKDRREPGRRAVDARPPQTRRVVVAACRQRLAGLGIVIAAGPLALAAQFFEAGADRREIVGCKRAAHRTSCTRIGRLHFRRA